MTAILGSAECFFCQGFCLPKEIIEDGGQGGTEFHDYEDGGIGDGEGKKDVSDKIENEDQVRFEVSIYNLYKANECQGFSMYGKHEKMLLLFGGEQTALHRDVHKMENKSRVQQKRNLEPLSWSQVFDINIRSNLRAIFWGN